VKSTMVITHDLSILAQVADTILVMYAGKLAEKAPADVVIGSPLHPYTQALISSLPEVGVRHDQKTLVGIPGRPPTLLNRDRMQVPRAMPRRFRPVRRAAAVPGGQAGSLGGVLAPCRRGLTGRRRCGLAGRRRCGVLTLDNVTKVFKTGTFGGTSLPAVRKASFEILRAR